MKNNFSAYTKDSNGNYTVKIENTVFPFSSSALLDERLNEAILYISTNETQAYEPTTEVKIEAFEFEIGANGEKVRTNQKDYYYIVSNDISQELPNGSGKYKHEIHLIERTKLLEGIYCQSLCFTNPSGNVYTNSNRDISATNGAQGDNEYYQPNQEFLDALYKFKVFIPANEEYTTPSTMDIGNSIADVIRNSAPGTVVNVIAQNMPIVPTVKTGIYIDNNGETIEEIGINTSITFTPASATIKIIYTIVLEVNDSAWCYKLIYTPSGVQNKYPLKPWTITDCVNRCLDLAEPLFEGETPRYIFAPSQAEKYANILAPEFTMTQCTLREQLKVIGGFIHAEPRLTENNEIVFDEYGIGTEASIANKPYIYKGFKHDINEYCTHIETSASNLVNSLNYGNGTVTEPNINNVRTLRTDNVNVMLSDTNAFANTDNKIYDISNQEGGVFITLFNADGSIYTDNGFTFENIDITPYIFESHEYNNLSSYDSTYPYSKSFALYYTRGEKGIRGLFFKNENAVSEYFSKYAIVNIINAVTGQDVKSYVTEQFPRIAFKITYTPIYDTKFSHSKQTIELGKKPFMRVYNQSENLIESKWYGEHIKGVAQRLGNEEQTRTYILSSLNDIPEIGQTIDGYFIVDVKTEIQFNFIKCTVELTRDFNRISQYVGISSNKRVFEVAEANTYARDILLKNYVVVSDKVESVLTDNAIIQSTTPIAQIFDPSYSEVGASDNPINAVVSRSYSKTGTEPFGEIILPVISSAFGNTMVFSWDFKDNYSVGEQVDKYIGQDSEENDVEQMWQTDVPYGDYYGRAYWHVFGLLVAPNNGGYDQAKTVRLVSSQPASSYGTQNKYLLRKDSRERLSINCELEFVTTQSDIIIGSALAPSCPLVSGKTYENQPTVRFYKTDTKGALNKFERFFNVDGNVAEETLTVADGSISFNLPNVDFDYWVIVTPVIQTQETVEDEDGNVTTITRVNGSEVLLARAKSKARYGNATTETITFQIAKTIYDR